MYFDAAVVFVTNSSLLFRLAMAILCSSCSLHSSCTALLRSPCIVSLGILQIKKNKTFNFFFVKTDGQVGPHVVNINILTKFAM